MVGASPLGSTPSGHHDTVPAALPTTPPPRRPTHRRGRSEPLSPAHRLAVACEGGKILHALNGGGPSDWSAAARAVNEPGLLPFHRAQSLPNFGIHWDPTAEWTARSARMLATALCFIALIGWVAMPATDWPQTTAHASLNEPVRRPLQSHMHKHNVARG